MAVVEAFFHSAGWSLCRAGLATIVLMYCDQALRAVPDVNAGWMGEFIRKYHNIDVSVAVQTPSGLMVPIVRDADALGLSEIAAAVKELAAKVRVLL